MKNILVAVMLIFTFSLFAQNNEGYLKITPKSCTKKKGSSLVLKEVLSDSRCPEGVSCIWAGEIKVVVAVYQDRKFVKDETVTISGSNSQENKTWFAQYLPVEKRNIKSIIVAPRAKEGVKIKPKDYYIRITYIK